MHGLIGRHRDSNPNIAYIACFARFPLGGAYCRRFLASMPSDGLLKQFGLHRNPFTDRTAEKTQLDDVALYVHSDLQGFTPSGALSPSQDPIQSLQKIVNYSKHNCVTRPLIKTAASQRPHTSSLAGAAAARRQYG